MLELHPTSFNNKLSHDNIIENTQVSIYINIQKEVK